ncbi:MAG: efflux RND transporter permease subunit, partial [Erysipelotrichaceae bacterium]|nr:efflux RND transporter permease subunit [Erysipelotrichaceae bacterium]
DTRDLSEKETAAYVVIAVLLCMVVLTIATDSYLVPILLLGNIGVAILYNMGTNVFLGEISYITKAISAVLQLGVTTDFSIFLYHKYEHAKEEYMNRKEAMEKAIEETFKSVVGSSLTTIAGFLALCSMNLTLGRDIGLVMAKGVVCGLVCVLTLFPALLLVFDHLLEKTKHRVWLPQFKKVQEFSIKHYKIILIVFILLLIPAWYGNQNVEVYYKLDKSLPESLGSSIANSQLKEKYHIVSPEIILIDKNMKTDEVTKLTEELQKVEGIDFVLAPTTILDFGLPTDMLPEELIKFMENDQYQLVLLNSSYEIASNELNDQIDIISGLVKSYDKNAIIAGEGPLMKDLTSISDEDFKNVNSLSIIIIFILMLLVLKSISLPVILVIAIEFAIFINMSIAYYSKDVLPFIASIVIGTIQLGATIDYAILMSTKYIEERTKNQDKMVAMKNTLASTVPSIIVSACCFFAATVGVYLYSKIDMIGAICNLLSRGSIISMLVVILILPSLLLVFDKVIRKTTKDLKEVR